MRAWKSKVTNGTSYCLEFGPGNSYHTFRLDKKAPKYDSSLTPSWGDYHLSISIIKADGYEVKSTAVPDIYKWFCEWLEEEWNVLALEKRGGDWLAAAQDFILWKIPGSEHVNYEDSDTVTLTLKQIDEMAAEIAEATVRELLGTYLRSGN